MKLHVVSSSMVTTYQATRCHIQ